MDRGLLLIISGQKDNTVPWAIANASFKQQKDNAGVTLITEIPNRGHSLTIERLARDGGDGVGICAAVCVEPSAAVCRAKCT